MLVLASCGPSEKSEKEKRVDRLEGKGGKLRLTGRALRAAQLEDMNSVRNLVGLIVVTQTVGKPPTKDGALDVYFFVRKGDIAPKYYSVLRSARSETNPTDAEIERGDYTNFPWERYRGERRIDRPPAVPLLWDKQPDAEGKFVVGFSDGSARLMDRDELDEALKE
jgi:hypothetical protein